MRPLSLGRRGQLQAHIEPLEPFGYGASRILERDGVSGWLHGAPHDWVPVRYIGATIDLAARATGDEQYGFWLAEQGPIEGVPMIGKAISQSLTVYDSLRAASRTIRHLISDVNIWLAEDGDKIWFCKSEPGGAEAGRRHLEQYSLLKMVHVVQLGLGSNWKPAGIQVRAPDARHFENWQTFADASMLCGQSYSAIAVPKSSLGLPIPNSSPKSLRQALQRLRGEPPAQDFAGSLRQVIGAHLVEGALSIEEVAEIAGISSRTLKRRLASDGLTYRMLVDQTRYRAAERLLREPDVPIREIAHVVGYADAPHFWRAFRRWSGVTPGEYRKYRQGQVLPVD